MPLDDDVAALMGQLAQADGPAMTEVPPAAAREMYRAMQSMNPIADIASQTDSQAGDVPIRIYRDNETTTPCIVYFHGGGWVIGDLDTHDCICTQLAKATGYAVIAVDYRLAPEHPFPAPLDDCFQALCWIAAHADTLNIDATRLVVAGDSAGGNLAASVCLLARDQGGPDIQHQLLLYPVTDTAMDTASYRDNAEGYLLTRAGMEWFWHHYVGDDADARRNPLAAPLKAEHLADLPSACVITAEFDPLRDEGEAYGAALQAAGVATTIKRYDGTVHGFFGMSFDGSKAALIFAADTLKAALA